MICVTLYYVREYIGILAIHQRGQGMYALVLIIHGRHLQYFVTKCKVRPKCQHIYQKLGVELESAN